MRTILIFAALLAAAAALDGYMVMIAVNAFGHSMSYENAVAAGIGITAIIGSGTVKGQSLSK